MRFSSLARGTAAILTFYAATFACRTTKDEVVTVKFVHLIERGARVCREIFG